MSLPPAESRSLLALLCGIPASADDESLQQSAAQIAARLGVSLPTGGLPWHTILSRLAGLPESAEPAELAQQLPALILRLHGTHGTIQLILQRLIGDTL